MVQLLRTMPRQLVNTSKHGGPATSLGNLRLCSVTLAVKKCYLMFRRSLLCFPLCALPLDLCLSSAEKGLAPSSLKPPSDVNTGGSFGCSDHTLVEFAALRDMGQAKSKVRTLTVRQAKFQLFKELVNATPRETARRDKGAEQSWQIFKGAFHRV